MPKLSLRSESLTELTADELTAVAGGATSALFTDTCVSHRCTGLMCLFSEAVCFEG